MEKKTFVGKQDFLYSCQTEQMYRKKNKSLLLLLLLLNTVSKGLPPKVKVMPMDKV